MLARFMLFGALALVPSLATAADIPSEGPIDSTFTWVASPVTLPMVDGRSSYTAESMLVVTAAGPGSVLDKMAARCLGAGEVDANGRDQSQGWCTFTDAEGDQIFERWEETIPSAGAPGAGRGTLLGGTGKYVGISGEYEISDSLYYGMSKDGTYHGMGRKKGSYRIQKP